MCKTWCEGKSIALEIEEHEPADLNRLFKKFYAEVKNQYDLPALPPREFFHVYIINKQSYVLKNSLVQISSKLNSKPYDYLYKIKLPSEPLLVKTTGKQTTGRLTGQ